MASELNNPLQDLILDAMSHIQVKTEGGAMPAPEDYYFWIAQQSRSIYFIGEVNDDCSFLSRMIIEWNKEDIGLAMDERKPIKLFIQSNGGMVSSMWSLIDIILASETPVYTINMGNCASAASLIFMAGEKRYMMPRATVLIHSGAAEISGDAVKVFDQADSYKKEVQKMMAYILERTDIPKTTLSKHKNNDWEIDATYCSETNVCTDIVKSLNDII